MGRQKKTRDKKEKPKTIHTRTIFDRYWSELKEMKQEMPTGNGGVKKMVESDGIYITEQAGLFIVALLLVTRTKINHRKDIYIQYNGTFQWINWQRGKKMSSQNTQHSNGTLESNTTNYIVCDGSQEIRTNKLLGKIHKIVSYFFRMADCASWLWSQLGVLVLAMHFWSNGSQQPCFLDKD